MNTQDQLWDPPTRNTIMTEVNVYLGHGLAIDQIVAIMRLTDICDREELFGQFYMDNEALKKRRHIQ